jgi:hypothetical protein
MRERARVRVYESSSCAIWTITPHPGLLPLKGRRNFMKTAPMYVIEKAEYSKISRF